MTSIGIISFFIKCNCNHKYSVIRVTDNSMSLTYYSFNARRRSHTIIESINRFHLVLIFLCSEQTRGNPGTQSNGTNELPDSMSAEPPEIIRDLDVYCSIRGGTSICLTKRHASFF